MKPRSHTHDWQWSEQHNRYLCACGESMLSEDIPAAAPIDYVSLNDSQQQPQPVVTNNLEQPRRVKHTCVFCLGSGYSDYAIGQPCAVCGGWGYWEEIV